MALLVKINDEMHVLLNYIFMAGNVIAYPNRGAFQILECSMYGGSGWLETTV